MVSHTGDSQVKTGKSGLYEDLKRQILTMELGPDEMLDEVSLSEKYGLSRTPVREILRRLDGEGYLEIKENRGTRVSPMNYSTIRNFFLVAPMTYAAVGRLAVQNFTAAQLEDLKQTQLKFRQAALENDPMAMVVENNRFHEIMAQMADNPYLMASMNRLLIDHARIAHTVFRPRNADMQWRLEQAVNHHDAFIEAIAGHDEERVVDLVFEHWELSRENMQIFVVPEGLKPDTKMS